MKRAPPSWHCRRPPAPRSTPPAATRAAPPTWPRCLATDNVFRDGATLETPTVSGSVSNGYTAALTVGGVP